MEEKITLKELLKKSNCFNVEIQEIEISHETEKRDVVRVDKIIVTDCESVTNYHSLETEIFQWWEDNKTLYIMILV